MRYQQRRRLARKPPEPTTVVGLETPGLPTRLYRVPTAALPRLEQAEREAKFTRALQVGLRQRTP